ncbi:MAG TPA: hypothetical protein VFE01_11305, partial [Terracidiphilus sp.]|nr:hypothetical protein [Terracidiphilus sp.]
MNMKKGIWRSRRGMPEQDTESVEAATPQNETASSVDPDGQNASSAVEGMQVSRDDFDRLKAENQLVKEER